MQQTEGINQEFLYRQVGVEFKTNEKELTLNERQENYYNWREIRGNGYAPVILFKLWFQIMSHFCSKSTHGF